MVMEDRKMSTFISLLSLFLLSFVSHPTPVIGRRHHVSLGNTTRMQTYIVHVQHPEKVEFDGPEERDDWYKSFFSKITTADGTEGPLWVYSYHHVLSGFAARLTEEEMKAMEAKEGFVHAYPDRLLPLLTTHTPDFLGLQLGKGLWGSTVGDSFGLGKGVVIGMVDSGVFPDHPSFNDEGMPPPPSTWRGSCEFEAFCNNKIIGAKSFTSEGFAINDAGGGRGVNATAVTMAPIDNEGHGTHTASTAAGAFVKNTSVLGNANGTAVGMAPLAHLAIYKVCTEFGCFTSDILAGLDAAIEDGVDLLSVSLGGSSAPFHSDAVAIGAFGAVEKGIFFSGSAGNDGPMDATLSNEAPWILTVAASTMDRSITATVTLGDGQEFDGQSAFQPAGDFPSSMLSLVYPLKDMSRASYCENGSLDDVDVKGKVVLCNRGGDTGRIAKGSVVKAAGGAAMILMNEEDDAYSTLADVHVIATSHVSFSDGSKIKDYIKSSNKPTVSITFKGTILGTSPAPTVASFSSRGPSQTSPDILKPDITGPGVSVLAAWPPFPIGPPSANNTTKTRFNMISGTSMSTPHLSGIAALLKSTHPDWSPAAIKSAIITTSDIVANDRKPIRDEKLRPASFFAMGAGHVNPSKAADPGLVYDLGADDYIPYLCGLGYTDAQVGAVVRRKITCSNATSIFQRELNYPSLTVTLSPSTTVTVKRTVTNVGEASEGYTVEVDEPVGVSVSVAPKMLQFSKVKEKKSFTVSFSGNGDEGKVYQGNLRWISSKHTVRSPLSVVFI